MAIHVTVGTSAGSVTPIAALLPGDDMQTIGAAIADDNFTKRSHMRTEVEFVAVVLRAAVGTRSDPSPASGVRYWGRCVADIKLGFRIVNKDIRTRESFQLSSVINYDLAAANAHAMFGQQCEAA